MDSEKLLRILKDLEQDEKSLGIDGKIEAIRTDLAQNTPEAFAAAESKLSELLTEIRESSITYKYSQSEQLLLQHIKGSRFFGRGLVLHLEKIFNSRSFELIGKVDELRSQRSDFIQKAQRLAAGFTEIGIEEYRPNSYEVGLILPEDQSDVESMLKRVRDLNLLLSALAEAVSDKHQPIKISRVSNGTIELFSLQPVEIAVLLSTLLVNVILIWDKVAKFRKKIENVDKDEELSTEGKNSMKKILQKETEKLKEEIIKDLPENFLKKNLEKGRANEVRNKIEISVRAIFAWFEVGVEIDITPIRVVEESNTPPDPKTAEQAATIQGTTMRLQKIYQLPQELRKLPFELPEVSEIENNNSSPQEKVQKAKKA